MASVHWRWVNHETGETDDAWFPLSCVHEMHHDGANGRIVLDRWIVEKKQIPY